VDPTGPVGGGDALALGAGRGYGDALRATDGIPAAADALAVQVTGWDPLVSAAVDTAVGPDPLLGYADATTPLPADVVGRRGPDEDAAVGQVSPSRRPEARASQPAPSGRRASGQPEPSGRPGVPGPPTAASRRSAPPSRQAAPSGSSASTSSPGWPPPQPPWAGRRRAGRNRRAGGAVGGGGWDSYLSGGTPGGRPLGWTQRDETVRSIRQLADQLRRALRGG
jgi:hypothetical protein